MNCKKRVVFTTLYQAGRLQTKDGSLPSWKFDTAIFDEASQVRDTDVVKVIAKCAGTLKRVIMVGDQEQLGPIIHDELITSGHGRLKHLLIS